MLQSEATNVGGNATIGTGGGFPDFVRIGSGKQHIGISGEGSGGNCLNVSVVLVFFVCGFFLTAKTNNILI